MSEELDALFEELDEGSDEPNDAINIPEVSTSYKASIVETTIQQPEAEPPVDVLKYHKRLDEVTENVIDACAKDRAEIQEVVDLMFDEIRNDREAGRNPSRGYTDNLTKLLEVKANVNMLAVKIMEANAKMLSATKAGAATTINNNLAVAQGDDYLKRILEEPMNEGDTY